VWVPGQSGGGVPSPNALPLLLGNRSWFTTDR